MKLQANTLSGKICAAAGLKAKIAANGALVGRMIMPVGYKDYTGDYDVTPKTSEQMLQTKDKHLTDNVTIKAIPYFETANLSGGNTAYIAKEI